MNNKSKFRFAILLFGVLSAFISTSCSGDNNGSLPDDPSQGGGALPVKQVSLSRKTAYGNDWIYYSLEKGKEVNVSEETHAENTDWDIAFNRYNVRTNSGASGKGKGGALLTNISLYDSSSRNIHCRCILYHYRSRHRISSSYHGVYCQRSTL